MFDINALKNSYKYNSMNYLKQWSASNNCDYLFNFNNSSSNSKQITFSTNTKSSNTSSNTSSSNVNLSDLLNNMRSRLSSILSNKSVTKQTTQTEEDVETQITKIKQKATQKTEQKEVEQETKVSETKQEQTKTETETTQTTKTAQTTKTSQKYSLNINGEIDESVEQGGTGDCWVLSSLFALNATEKGKEIIKNSITVNSDETVTVTLNGINKSYTITADEIKKYDTDENLSDSLSNGDNDVLAFEIAIAKLRIDLAEGKVTTNKSFANYNNGETSDYGTAINDGYDVAMLYYLTGNTPTVIQLNSTTNNTYKALNYILNNSNSESSAIVVDISAGTTSVNCTDGTTYDLSLSGNHSVSMKNLTKTTLTIVDSWDTSKEYTMTWAEFAKLNAVQIAYTNLD